MDLALDRKLCAALMGFGTLYQWMLILLGTIATLLFGAFFYREIFPEYRLYQNDYIALEEFRSTYTHEPPPPFKEGIKQILIEREDKGPAVVDRCISCHAALQVEAFSPTRIAKDLNGNTIYDPFGVPVKEENPDFIWKKLDEAIAEEKNPGKKAEMISLKTEEVGDHIYDVQKVLIMHPLMGRETRPFEFHPIEEYGCTSCHGGNGNGLVTDRAHGPVFDGQYEAQPHGFIPHFLEKDLENDPPFSKVFNSKPGHRLLFQTNPLYVGALIQAKCMQCHQSSKDKIQGAANNASMAIHRKEKEIEAIQKGIDLERQQIDSLELIQKLLKEKGVEGALAYLEKQAGDYTLPYQEREAFSANVKFLKKTTPEEVESRLQKARESLDAKLAALNESEELIKHIQEVSGKFDLTQDEAAIGQIQSDIDVLTKDYQRGKSLFLSQGCYACHRIAGSSRGGVGPELSQSGDGYPWFIKESIVWPQADLKTSTMPNFRLDHEELEALMTYLLGQSSKNKTLSDPERKRMLAAWDAGKKLPWEMPVREVKDLKYGMKVFAVEGCASCHRLKGYESNVGFKEEKESKWFEGLFPETIVGSQIVQVIEKNQKEIDEKIVDNVRKDSILEEIENEHPGAIEALYSNFKFAARAKKESEWKARVSRVLKMYIQTYGFGRLICPRPNWSGVYRSDQWLMEHFKNPASHVPNSIMPVFPFDDSKFAALTYTLDQLGEKNTAGTRAVIEKEGFDPERAYQETCAQCHGKNKQGDGPVSEWIYPIPKNLLRSEFLRNLTKDQAIMSITHGVKGTPMPPWGEVGSGKNVQPVFTEDEIKQLVDWLFSTLPLKSAIPSENPKWHYSAKDVSGELNEEVLDHDYIKQEYYTPENIQAGKRFFIENCAACHGKEADGAGLRAEAMSDAKPRMLTNLDWIHSRDDLRLLRSIKYGVPGTAMTPWGDLTSPLQRLQLVVFIRSLSKEAAARRELTDAIYSLNASQKAKDIYYKVGMGFGNEKLQKDWIQFITTGTPNEEAILSELENDTKQKRAVISGLAEIKRLKE